MSRQAPLPSYSQFEYKKKTKLCFDGTKKKPQSLCLVTSLYCGVFRRNLTPLSVQRYEDVLTFVWTRTEWVSSYNKGRGGGNTHSHINKTKHRTTFPSYIISSFATERAYWFLQEWTGACTVGWMREKHLEASSGGESMQMFNLLMTGELYQRWSSYTRHRTSEFIAGTLSDSR